MPRVSKQRILDDKDRFLFLDDFYSGVTLLQNKQEVKTFFRDFLTREEELMLAKRFQATMMIIAGHSNLEIDHRVKITQGTVDRLRVKLEAGKGKLIEVAQRILDLKFAVAQRETKRQGYKFSESELLKNAVFYGISRAAQAISKRRKQASITK